MCVPSSTAIVDRVVVLGDVTRYETCKPSHYFSTTRPSKFTRACACCVACTQLRIVMSFINATKRLGTKIVSSIRVSVDHVSLFLFFLFLSYCGRGMASKKNMRGDGGRSDMLPLGLRSDSLFVVSWRIGIRRAWRIVFPWPAKRTAYSFR